MPPTDLDTSKRILIVDDFPTMRRILCNELRDLGFQDVALVEDGEAALKALRSGDFDLLVTGLDMPLMSGIELTLAIRTDSKLRDLPILMVSSASQRVQILKAIDAGVTQYVVKPFNAEVLRHKIRAIFPE